MLGRLRAVDLGVVGLYLVGITAFGLRFARKGTAKDKSLRGYFLADRTVPWWAIALSIVSAETSTLTIIGTPGLAFAGDFGFLQLVMGYMLGRVVVAALFLPRYFQGEMLTAYQLIERRFGRGLYKTTAGLFLLTRAAAEGVRVFAVSIVVGIAIGTGDVLSIAIISALTLLYTFEGGMAAVIWTDVVQMAIYVGGTAVALWSLGMHVPGGWAAIHATAAAAGKFKLWDFAWSLTRTYTFWAGVLGGTFLTMASHGTDQLMVQRMLAAKNLRESRTALLSSGVVIFVQFAMFLLIGAGLWVFYGQHPAALQAVGGAAGGNRIFPGFIVQEMPVGIAGLLVAAILAAAMSNLSAALNSLSSTTVVDFYMGWKPGAGDGERMMVSRASTVMWALVLFAVAVYSVKAGGKGNVVEIGLSIASVAYGCLLGVFLLGTLTKYATQAGAIVGMVCGFVTNLVLWRWPGHGVVPNVAWTWYVLIGAAVTFVVGMGASAVLRKRGVKVKAAVAAVVVLGVVSGRLIGQVPQGLKPHSSRGYPMSGLKPGAPSGTPQRLVAQSPPSAVAEGWGTRLKPLPSSSGSMSGLKSGPISDGPESVVAQRPQGLKPAPLNAVYGTGEPVPLSKTLAAMEAFEVRGTEPEDVQGGNPMSDKKLSDMGHPAVSAAAAVAQTPPVRFAHEWGTRLRAQVDGSGGTDTGILRLAALAQNDNAKGNGSFLGSAQSGGGTNTEILSASAQNDTANGSGKPVGTTQVGGGSPTSDKKLSDMGHPGSYGFSAVSSDVEKAIGEKKLPGAVVLVGHGGKVVFEQAYGVRKYAGEPGVDGKPSPAEPMTVDTIFDMASLTKCLVTATAVMQLVEQGKVDVDAPVVRYLPEFGVNGKEKVTVRELLTHYSGLPPDVDLKDAWGLKKPDKAEGIRRAMESKLVSVPGTHFEYSDINFITLGAIVEKVSGEALDVYAQRHIFEPLRMTHSSYHPFEKTCGPAEKIGAAVYSGPKPVGKILVACPRDTWSAYALDPLVAPTQHDDQGTKETNPDFDWLLRGTVHDPTTRRMGGVAGHAGLFSTAEDVSKFAQALLDKLLYDKGPFPLKQTTLRLMTVPEEPSTAEGGATVFAQDGTATKGVALRGFGWDINSAFSRPRGSVFPTVVETSGVGSADPTHGEDAAVNGAPSAVRPSFGHTGFTGTSLWIDPESDTYVILLANSVHPRGAAPISPLRGQVATDVAKALGVGLDPTRRDEAATNGAPGVMGNPTSDEKPSDMGHPRKVAVGIDVLEGDGFAELKELAAKHGGKLRVGLLTNQTGVDAEGRRTIDVLKGAGGGIEGTRGIELVRLFSPEHGLFGAKDTTEIGQEVDAATGLKVVSLYGAKPEDRRPKAEDLKDLDAVVVDLQDAGVRFYTYETVVGYFVEASACEAARGHRLEVVVLDRPALIGGVAVQGPVSDTAASYINYMPEPVRNGMTLGELAEYDAGERAAACGVGKSGPQGLKPSSNSGGSGTAEAVPLSNTGTGAEAPSSADGGSRLKPKAEALGYQTAANPDAGPSTALRSAQDDEGTGLVTVVKMQGWRRGEFFDETGVKWVNPSPNLRTMEGAVLYPGLGMLDATNVSVGRGTDTPFEVFGAGVPAVGKDGAVHPAWFDGKKVAAYLTARKIPGVEFVATRFAVAETAEKYPYHGQTIEGVRMKVTDRKALDSPEMGVEILSALEHLYPKEFQLQKAAGLVANTETMEGLEKGVDPRVIAEGWKAGLGEFEAKRERWLLY